MKAHLIESRAIFRGLRYSRARNALQVQKMIDALMDGHDADVVQQVETLLTSALSMNASDIHVEPFQDGLRVRFRIDGLLREIVTLPATLAPRVVSRLKIMSNLDISEKRLPQDGRYRLQPANEKPADFRVSTCPVIHGEKVVLRLLEQGNASLPLNALGMLPEQLALLERVLSRPQGLVLVTGPTGSGKTITLYAALVRLNAVMRNIATVEDPVEILLNGINQVAINPKTGLDFATVLRALLRQDPDVLMIGEIRDRETAEIAVKAAHTGHLVLSTLHTTSAAESLVRLQHMGIAAWLLATSLSLVIAQRLVRVLCVHCRIPDTEGTFKAQGCSRCNQGYQGRTGIFEVLNLDDTLRDAILRGDNTLKLQALSRECGMLSLNKSGTILVRAGVTTAEELYRVTGEEAADA